MFRAFFDETGKDPSKDKAFVMGGFLARVEDWLGVSDAWDECLRASPAIDYFKHAECENLHEQFWRFSREQADRKKYALAEVIGNFKLRGFCAIVPHGIVKGKPVQRGLVGSRVYDWGFATATKLVLHHMASEPQHEKVDFIFDECTELRANIQNFNSMQVNPFFTELMSHSGTCVPGNDREVIALQMADFLAGEFLKAGEEQIQSDALELIRERNTIGYLRCDPPVQHIPLMDIFSFANELQREAGQFIKLQRQNSITQEELRERLASLLAKEAFFNVQYARMTAFLEADPDYQKFRRDYMEKTGIDPMCLPPLETE